MKSCAVFLNFACCLFAISPRVAGDEIIDFNRDIRPILSENCFHCHGPDAKTREADLRLDRHAGALDAIKVGDRSKSELFARVNSQDEFERMPPVDSNRELTPRQIELLGQWIDQGAEWGQHWSWTQIVSPTVPKIESSPGLPIRNSIDAFVQHKLIAERLAPAKEADKSTLIRRVTLDLTGLSPTHEEVQQFLDDDSENAYEKVVDRLLASPAYGERMAWDWLDAARYADSNGYQGDMERTMWPWRDWVIRAFNDNMPYDQFTIWQLAGDLLPDATFEQKLATGFCRNHMINGEGGRIPEENRVDYVMDMAETTGTLWLGLTMNCCRCHDHKFDQLRQADYYELFAFFNQTPVTGAGRDPQTAPILAAPTEDDQAKLAELQSKIDSAWTAISRRARVLAASQFEWELKKLAALEDTVTWHHLIASSLEAEHQQLEQFEDGSIFASGPNAKNDTYTVQASVGLKKVTGLRLDALMHESHFNGALARSDSGNFVLTEIEIFHLKDGNSSPIKIASAEATYEQGGLKIEKAFDGKSNTGWAVHEGKPVDREHAAVFHFDKPVEMTEDSKLQVILRHDSQHASHNIGRFLLSVTDQKNPALSDENGSLKIALATDDEQRTDEQRKLISKAHHADDEEYVSLVKVMKEAKDRLEKAKDRIAKVMVMEDLEKPRDSFILDRGLYNAPGEKVTADVPESLPPLPEGVEANRLALAQWLVSDKNPLTARVVVNRFWQQVFGIGLVKTAEDFGTQGELPIHRELLDWLASDFRESGWNVKRLMKQIVMSHTYRQSSRVTKQLYELDPQNRLLARGARYRLPSWMLRDQALAISGLLVNRRGGPSVNVYQPPGIWEEATFGKKKYSQDHGESLYRRSLYVFWRRIIGPTVFFDNASRQTCTVKVFRTNTPLHSLLTFNDVTYVEAARVFAERVLTSEMESDSARLDRIFLRAIARVATEQEREIMLAGLNRSRREFASNSDAVTDLLKVGESPRDDSIDPIEHASWTALCLAVLNLDETLTKE